MQNPNQIAASEKRVLIFAAQTPRASDRQIYFLFSQHQMEDIVMDSSVRPVPFSPCHIEGLAEWQNQVLPVISLETCLGMKSLISQKIQRLMVIRAQKNESAPMGFYRIMVRMVPPIRMLTLPIECRPVSHSHGWIPENPYIMGVYEWEHGFLVVAHMNDILNGRN
jgi:chemotaxis signal transduction protein